MTLPDQETLLGQLAAMPDYLATTFGRLSPAEASISGPEESFSAVEHCWHLADLERDGFAVRIRRLLAEDNPVLPDFDGARVAAEREYRKLSLPDGIRALAEARRANLTALRSIAARDWERTAYQEGVGRVALCDIPSMMAEHDAGHRQEIEAWMDARGR
jgi:hypothetical protein